MKAPAPFAFVSSESEAPTDATNSSSDDPDAVGMSFVGSIESGEGSRKVLEDTRAAMVEGFFSLSSASDARVTSASSFHIDSKVVALAKLTTTTRRPRLNLNRVII